MSFEIYRSRSVKEGQKPLVSLSKTSIVLNKTAREKLEHPEYIELAFDRDTNTVRIQAAVNNEGHLLKKTKLFAKGFYNYFKLNTTGKYYADFNTEEKALYVNLKSGKKP